MKNFIIADNGKVRRADDVEFAEKIIKRKNNEDKWNIVDDLVKYWAKYSPEEVDAIKVNVNQYRETQKDKKYAQTLQGTNMERRFILAFPRHLMLLIRAIYKSDELPMDRAFYTEFAKKYPAFKVANQV